MLVVGDLLVQRGGEPESTFASSPYYASDAVASANDAGT
jgi:hypothetical protein